MVAPILDEVMKGFNCTIFAYGQTGTGKTYTMEGGGDPGGGTGHWRPNSIYAGVIPRAIHHIFQMLNVSGEAEFEHSVRVSHLELYNEELIDLLCEEEKQLKLFDDGNKGVRIANLEEALVCSADEISDVLEKSSQRRHVNSTRLNDSSSRSHCIFTITIHMKETTPAGEDLIKIGKLNLVDLAGSENVGRSGAQNMRKREAGNINQSLLTLGRVITALTDNHPHVPYRESKLTRLLQESLGGRAKTAIIATVSPASDAFDETLSTLEYAYRAKNIKNMPEVNQKMTKRALIKDYEDEIERLKAMLTATRTKNGVYLPPDEYAAMQVELRAKAESSSNLEGQLELKTKELAELGEVLHRVQDQLDARSADLKSAKEANAALKLQLADAEQRCEQLQVQLAEERAVVAAHESAHNASRARIAAHLAALDAAQATIDALHGKIARSAANERAHAAAHAAYKARMAERVAELEQRLGAFAASEQLAFGQLTAQLDAFRVAHSAQLGAFDSHLAGLSTAMAAAVERVCQLALQHKQGALKALDADAAQSSEQAAAAADAARQFRGTVAALIAELSGAVQRQAELAAAHVQATNADADKARFRVTSFAATQQQLLLKARDDTKAAIDAHRAQLAEHAELAHRQLLADRERTERERVELCAKIGDMLGTLLGATHERTADTMARLSAAVSGAAASVGDAQSALFDDLSSAVHSGKLFRDDFVELAERNAVQRGAAAKSDAAFVADVARLGGALEQQSGAFVGGVDASNELRAATLAKQADAMRSVVNKFYMTHNFTFESSKTDYAKVHSDTLAAAVALQQHVAASTVSFVAATNVRAAQQHDFAAAHAAQLRSLQLAANEFTSRLTPTAATGETPIKQPLQIVRSLLPMPKRADIVAGLHRVSADDEPAPTSQPIQLPLPQQAPAQAPAFQVVVVDSPYSQDDDSSISECNMSMTSISSDVSADSECEPVVRNLSLRAFQIASTAASTSNKDAATALPRTTSTTAPTSRLIVPAKRPAPAASKENARLNPGAPVTTAATARPKPNGLARAETQSAGLRAAHRAVASATVVPSKKK